MEEPSYLKKSMFGCLAVYLHGRMMLLLTEGEEPWNGLLIPPFPKGGLTYNIGNACLFFTFAFALPAPVVPFLF